MADDRVATYLEQVRKHGSSGEYYNPALLRNEDVPRLLAAVEAVLALHHEEAGKCARCRGAWPCGEYLEISAALLGEEKADARP